MNGWTPLAWKIKQALDSGDDARASSLLVELLVKHKGAQQVAAEKIGISDRSLRGWIARLAERGHDVRALAAKQGAPTKIGRRPDPEKDAKSASKK